MTKPNRQDAHAYDYQVARMALLFHDAYYQPLSPGFNETQSANLFEAAYTGLWRTDQTVSEYAPSFFFRDVITAISATAHHTQDASDMPLSVQWVLDVDLHELGTPKYLHNRHQLMKEAAVTGQVEPIQYVCWLIGFLVKMLNKPRIFYTEVMHGLYEDAARRILRGEYNLMWYVITGASHHQGDSTLQVPTEEDQRLFQDFSLEEQQHLVRNVLAWPTTSLWS